MESILAAAFGRVIDIQRGEADEVTEAVEGIFAIGKNMTVQICMGVLGKFRIIILYHEDNNFYYFVCIHFNL